MEKNFILVLTQCSLCREEFHKDVTNDRNLCPDCEDSYRCCKCGKTTPQVELIVSEQDDSIWCIDCADYEASLHE